MKFYRNRTTIKTNIFFSLLFFFFFLLLSLFHLILVSKQPPTAATKKSQSYSVDLSLPSEDKLIDPTNFEKFLLENIKVATKKNNLGTAITVSTKKEVITVTTSIPFAKRYLKYLVSIDLLFY